MVKYLSPLLSLLSLLSACAPRQQKYQLRASTTASPTREGPTAENTKKTGYFVAPLDPTKVDGRALQVYRLHLDRLQLGRDVVPRLSFACDGKADFVNWSLCPYEDKKKCRQGRSIVAALDLGLLEAGKYAITVQACVYPERALSPEQNCGPLQQVDWEQGEGGP